MKNKVQTRQPTKSKKAMEPQRLNAGILPTKVKRTNFQMVAVGVCPHDDASLLPPNQTSGAGEKATCTQCGHTWYINKKIRTCKCLSCGGTGDSEASRAG